MPDEFGVGLPLLAALPFALLVFAIAVVPMLAGHWWESHRAKALLTTLLSAPVALFLLMKAPHALSHSLHEYVSFVLFLGALYVVAGGVEIAGDVVGTPRANLTMLAIGAVLANLVGTTGASMLLVRVMLRSNRQRRHKKHIPIFFVMLVSNCAGLLTPLGDPPLFLGYLQGVPFLWTLRLAPVWLAVTAYLLAAFYIFDVRAFARESRRDRARDEKEREPIRIKGAVNIALLIGVVASSLAPSPYRECAMLLLACISLWFTPKEPRRANVFSMGPMLEVAILFLGLFITMVPALAILSAHGSSLGLHSPWQFFVTTGALSSMLDNAPTYLSFVSTAQSLGLPDEVLGMPHIFLVAISLGSVLMGANTYIGNGPNFMVKSIAEESGYSMPSFFGYAWRAVAILTPVYIAIAIYFTIVS